MGHMCDHMDMTSLTQVNELPAQHRFAAEVKSVECFRNADLYWVASRVRKMNAPICLSDGTMIKFQPFKGWYVVSSRTYSSRSILTYVRRRYPHIHWRLVPNEDGETFSLFCRSSWLEPVAA